MKQEAGVAARYRIRAARVVSVLRTLFIQSLTKKPRGRNKRPENKMASIKHGRGRIPDRKKRPNTEGGGTERESLLRGKSKGGSPPNHNACTTFCAIANKKQYPTTPYTIPLPARALGLHLHNHLNNILNDLVSLGKHHNTRSWTNNDFHCDPHAMYMCSKTMFNIAAVAVVAHVARHKNTNGNPHAWPKVEQAWIVWTIWEIFPSLARVSRFRTSSQEGESYGSWSTISPSSRSSSSNLCARYCGESSLYSDRSWP